MIDKFISWLFGPTASATSPFLAVPNRKTESLVARVLAYRGNGTTQNGREAFFQPAINDLDYALMGADCSCARIAAGNEHATEGRWFNIDHKSKLARQSFPNSHGTKVGEDWLTDVAYLSAPLPAFQCDPAEVVWHHETVLRLRADGVEQPERVQRMTEMRAGKPWATDPGAGG